MLEFDNERRSSIVKDSAFKCRRKLFWEGGVPGEIYYISKCRRKLFWEGGVPGEIYYISKCLPEGGSQNTVGVQKYLATPLSPY
jgi:hypothetical protein